MRLVVRIVAVIPFLAFLACGGRVEGSGDGGGNPTCPATIAQAGTACDLATQSDCAPTATYSACGQSAVSGPCTCAADGAGAATWTCAIPVVCTEPEPTPSACPSPVSINRAGDACDVSPELTCLSNIDVFDCYGAFVGAESCTCPKGAWECSTFALPTCSDASSSPPPCPAPQGVEQGLSCSSTLQQCPGNPRPCEGATFFDVFECDGDAWNDIVVTLCGGNVDGGLDGGSANED
jgi:hypothetical protein